MAYVDQLKRDDALSEGLAGDLDKALAEAEQAMRDGNGNRKLSNELKSLAKQLDAKGDSTLTGQRKAALATTLGGMASGLR